MGEGYMTNLHNILETIKNEGVKVHIKGKEVDIETISDQELEDMMQDVTDEESVAIIEEMQAQLGEDTMQALIAESLQELDDEEAMENDEEPTLHPILMLTPIGAEYAKEEFKYGIFDASYLSGQYTAFLNCGMTKQQAFELVGMQLRHQLDMEMFEEQAKLQKALKDKDVKLQSQIGALNQLLTQD